MEIRSHPASGRFSGSIRSAVPCCPLSSCSERGEAAREAGLQSSEAWSLGEQLVSEV